MQIFGVPSADFEKYKHHIVWHLQSFEDRSGGEATASDLAQEIMSGDKQCWLAWDGTLRACALTRVIEGNLKAVEVTQCAGHGREDWQEPIISEIRNWAKSIGATRLRTISRPGYTRFLKSMGLRETHRVMEQDL